MFYFLLFSYNESSIQQQHPTGAKLNKRVGFPSVAPPTLPGTGPPPRLHDAGARPPADSMLPPPPALSVPLGTPGVPPTPHLTK